MFFQGPDTRITLNIHSKLNFHLQINYSLAFQHLLLLFLICKNVHFRQRYCRAPLPKSVTHFIRRPLRSYAVTPLRILYQTVICFLDIALIHAARFRQLNGILNKRMPAFLLSEFLLTVQPITQQLSGIMHLVSTLKLPYYCLVHAHRTT